MTKKGIQDEKIVHPEGGTTEGSVASSCRAAKTEGSVASSCRGRSPKHPQATSMKADPSLTRRDDEVAHVQYDGHRHAERRQPEASAGHGYDGRYFPFAFAPGQYDEDGRFLAFASG